MTTPGTSTSAPTAGRSNRRSGSRADAAGGHSRAISAGRSSPTTRITSTAAHASSRRSGRSRDISSTRSARASGWPATATSGMAGASRPTAHPAWWTRKTPALESPSPCRSPCISSGFPTASARIPRSAAISTRSGCRIRGPGQDARKESGLGTRCSDSGLAGLGTRCSARIRPSLNAGSMRARAPSLESRARIDISFTDRSNTIIVFYFYVAVRRFSTSHAHPAPSTRHPAPRRVSTTPCTSTTPAASASSSTSRAASRTPSCSRRCRS